MCQEVNRETTVCPARKDGAGYKYVAENLSEFQDLGINPVPLSFDRLDEGNGFEETFHKNSACWHKSCRAKVSSSILQRNRKKMQACGFSPVKTRTMDGSFL